TANLAFNPMAFAFVTRPLVAPAGVESYVTSYNGITLRVVRGYDMKYKKEMLSMDVLYGYKTMYPELATRVLG
ncbi:P22 coat protein, partial [Clostridium tertium]